nr:ribonuclease H-like domain-containing protein [Tanacetum cinerariifolium]
MTQFGMNKHQMSFEKNVNIAISKLKKLIEKGNGKSVETKFDKPSVVRQQNAQRIPKPSVLGKPAPFSNSFERRYFSKTKSVPKSNVSEGLSKPVTTRLYLKQQGKLLSHLNFDYINLLLKKDIVIGLPKLKYVKDQLCSSCELSKAKRSSFKSKVVPCSKGRLNLLHMDLCGPMRVASINEKKNILSKGYRVYNKRTILIVESIHIRFDEIKEVSETSVANDTSGLVPQGQKASDYDNSDPVPQLHNVSSSADAHVLLQQELDLIFGPLYDEFFNACSNTKDTQPITNIQPRSASSTFTYVHAEENNDNQAEEHLPDDEFTKPLCAPAQEVDESSSHNISNSNVPTFNQPQVSEYRWTKDQALEQVYRNPSRPVQTR